MEITDNTKTLANALAENDQLRQQLEAAEAEIKRLESSWHVETLNRKDQLIAEQEAENDRLKHIIRDAREQKPVAVMGNNGSVMSKSELGNGFEKCLDGNTALYAAPVPAMQIQDDNWTTITKEEWNIPKLGQRVIVCIDGVVQTVPVTLDCTDSDFGLGQYYWDHDDFEESPFVKAGDSWMPWPTKPQSEVKPSC